MNILYSQSRILFEGASFQQPWQIAALDLSVKGCNEPREPFGEVSARSGTSHINASVWWPWIWAEAVACGPRNLVSLVKGDAFTQKTCQLDCSGLFSPRTPQKGDSGGSESGWEPTWSCVPAPPRTLLEWYLLYLT